MERMPVPEYSYETIFSAERRPEGLTVNQGRIAGIARFIEGRRDRISASLAGSNDPEKNFKNTARGYGAEADYELGVLDEHFKKPEDKISQIEEEMIRSYWGVIGEYVRSRERGKVQHNFYRAQVGKAREWRDRTTVETDRLNIESCTWRNQAIRTIFALRQGIEGRNYLRGFQQSIQRLGRYANKEEPGALWNGLVGMVEIIDSFEHAGWEAYLPFPEQDAVHHVDLWVKKGHQVLMVQAKEHRGEKPEVALQEIEVFDYKQEVDERLRREKDAANFMLTNGKNYAKLFRAHDPDCRVVPCWVDVTLTKQEDDVMHPVSGAFRLPDNMDQSGFVAALDEIESQGGRDG